MDARIDTASAEIATSLARMDGTLGRMESRLDHLEADVGRLRDEVRLSRSFTIGSVISTGFALAGLMIGMAVYADTMFARGLSTSQLIRATIIEMRQHP